MKRLPFWLLLLSLILMATGRVAAAPLDPPPPAIWLPLVASASLPTANLGGQITTASGEVVPGITVRSDLGHQTVTDAQGRYQLANLPPGKYLITPSQSGYVFRPRTLTVILDGSPQTGVNFVASLAQPVLDRIPLIANEGDASENATSFYLSGDSSYLNLIGPEPAARAGWVFQNVPVPPGATILSAYVRVNGFGQGAGHTLITGFAEDRAAPFAADGANRPSLRPVTAHSVSWLGTWPFSWTVFQTPELAPILQEIVSRPGWQSGGSLGLQLQMLSGSGWATVDFASPARYPAVSHGHSLTLYVLHVGP